MGHIEPDELAVLALDGREPDAAVRDHIDGCAVCLAEYEAYAHTAALRDNVRAKCSRDASRAPHLCMPAPER